MIRILRESCGQARNCPRVYQKDRATLIVNGLRVTDPDDLARVRRDGQSDDEVANYLPTELAPELGLALGEDELGSFIEDHFASDLFRLETLPRYAVDSDEPDYQRYITGADGPANNAEWLELLRRDTAAGRRSRRLRIFGGELSDYERFEAEWCYVPNAGAGEEIRILDARTAPDYFTDLGDFYLIDYRQVLSMNYDDEGHFEGAVEAAPIHRSVYRAAAELLWERAEPFAAWWAAHPEYRRENRSAA